MLKTPNILRIKLSLVVDVAELYRSRGEWHFNCRSNNEDHRRNCNNIELVYFSTVQSNCPSDLGQPCTDHVMCITNELLALLQSSYPTRSIDPMIAIRMARLQEPPETQPPLRREPRTIIPDQLHPKGPKAGQIGKRPATLFNKMKTENPRVKLVGYQKARKLDLKKVLKGKVRHSILSSVADNIPRRIVESDEEDEDEDDDDDYYGKVVEEEEDILLPRRSTPSTIEGGEEEEDILLPRRSMPSTFDSPPITPSAPRSQAQESFPSLPPPPMGHRPPPTFLFPSPPNEQVPQTQNEMELQQDAKELNECINKMGKEFNLE